MPYRPRMPRRPDLPGLECQLGLGMLGLECQVGLKCQLGLDMPGLTYL
jgi:hypothetical protein